MRASLGLYALGADAAPRLPAARHRRAARALAGQCERQGTARRAACACRRRRRRRSIKATHRRRAHAVRPAAHRHQPAGEHSACSCRAQPPLERRLRELHPPPGVWLPSHANGVSNDRRLQWQTTSRIITTRGLSDRNPRQPVGCWASSSPSSPFCALWYYGTHRRHQLDHHHEQHHRPPNPRPPRPRRPGT